MKGKKLGAERENFRRFVKKRLQKADPRKLTWMLLSDISHNFPAIKQIPTAYRSLPITVKIFHG